MINALLLVVSALILGFLALLGVASAVLVGSVVLSRVGRAPPRAEPPVAET